MTTSPKHSHPIQRGGVPPPGDIRPVAANEISCPKPTFRHLLAGFLAACALLFLGVLTASAHESPVGCTGSGLGIDLFANFGDVHIGDTIRYSARIFNSPFPACDATGITALVVTPDGHTNDITALLVRNFLTPGQSDFYTNVVTYVVRAQDILADGTVRATALDKGTIHQNDTDSHGGGNQGVNTEVNLPCVAISALCLGGVGENGSIRFSGTITNCGNNTLVGVAITNFVNNSYFNVAFLTNLAIGQSANFSGSWIPSNPCVPSVAVLTVVATDQFTATPRTVSSFTTLTCQNTVTPAIKVTKSCPVSPVAPGQLLTFSGTVSNTGDVTLTNVVVLNSWPVLNTPVFTLASLAPGASANFTGSYPAPTNCAVTDTLTASASSVCGVPVSSTATATCVITTTPLIVVTAICPVAPVVPGTSIVYSGTVRNAGNIPLTNIIVMSDQPAANTTVFTVSTLAPGAVSSFTSSVVVPANACSVATVFKATGSDICTLNSVSSTVTTTCAVITAPSIAVSLLCPAVSPSAGGLITYSGTVRNSGNVTLNNVFVVNNHPLASSPVIGPITLAPGAVTSFNASFTAPLDACSVSTTVKATGADSCSGLAVTDSASATCTLLTAPSIVVTQLCPVIPAIPGGILTYTGTVKNSGDVTLSDIVVLNNLSGATPVFTLASLAPGAVANFTGSFTACDMRLFEQLLAMDTS